MPATATDSRAVRGHAPDLLWANREFLLREQRLAREGYR
jgi:hypothetical protein